jgi:hypothetical protein
MDLLKAATALTKKGLSVIATDANKRAVLSWKKYQSYLPTDSELQEQFSHPKAKGIAVICGAVSKNLEIIDVDCKYDLTGSLFEDLMNAIAEANTELSQKVMVASTKSGGYHIYYRCKAIEGNQKLAQRPASEDEVKINPNEKVLVLIETRGEGGYAICPPTEGYKKLSGNITEITPDERAILFEICRSFNQLIIEQPKPKTQTTVENFAITPWEDYNQRGVDDMLQRLEAQGWTRNDRLSNSTKVRFKRPGNTDSPMAGDYNYDLNLFMVFTTSSVFEPLKGYKPSAVFTVLEAGGDFKKAARMLAHLGYGQKAQHFGSDIEKALFKKKAEGGTPEDLKKILIDKFHKSDDEAAAIVDNKVKQWGERLCIFWNVDDALKVTINRTRWRDFLHEVGGFGLYFYDIHSTIYRVVRVVDGLVEESSTEQMKKFILDYIAGLPDTFDGGITPTDLSEVVLKQYNNLFNEGFIEFLPSVQLDFLRDDFKHAYFPFRNGVVVVDSKGVKMVTYKDIKRVIWKKQVIDFNLSIDPELDADTCEYYNFLKKISGDDDDRLQYCMTLIGYALHRYKDPGKPFAIVLAEETENDKDGGGTGKGIFIKALSYLVKTVKMDGKLFKIDKSFSFQRVDLATQLIVIEDCARGLDFEKFNSQITEGSTVEKKNKDELFIEYKDSPKFAFTTNYTLNIKGNHGKRRTRVFEFSPFFGPKNTPADFFGHLLFDGWDNDEWNRFYNLMFFCLSVYLQYGIRETATTAKMKRKTIKLSCGEEFLEWFDHYLENGCDEWKPFAELYNNFVLENGFDKKDYSQKRFKRSIESSTEILDRVLETRRNRAASNRHEVKVHKNSEKDSIDEKVPF